MSFGIPWVQQCSPHWSKIQKDQHFYEAFLNSVTLSPFLLSSLLILGCWTRCRGSESRLRMCSSWDCRADRLWDQRLNLRNYLRNNVRLKVGLGRRSRKLFASSYHSLFLLLIPFLFYRSSCFLLISLLVVYPMRAFHLKRIFLTSFHSCNLIFF